MPHEICDHRRQGVVLMLQVLNQELKEANDVLSAKRDEVERIEKEVALLMQVQYLTIINILS